MESLAPDVKVLVDKMLQSSVDVLSKTAGPMLPAMLVSDGPPSADKMIVFDSGTLDGSLQSARETADRFAKTHRTCVLCWDGYATVGGMRTEAILMNLWFEGRTEPVLLVQRYTRRPFSLFGRLLVGAEDAP